MGQIFELAGREVEIAMTGSFAKALAANSLGLAELLSLLDLSQDSGLLYKWSDGTWHSERPPAGQGRVVFEGGWDIWNSLVPCSGDDRDCLRILLTQRDHLERRCRSLAGLRDRAAISTCSFWGAFRRA